MATTSGRRSAPAFSNLAAGLLAALALVGSITCSSSSDSPTSPPPAGATTVGVIGCSQTSNAWRGWLDTGDSTVWRLFTGYGGGDVSEWARSIPNGDYWARFDSNIDGNPAATAIWWQICDIVRRPGTLGDAQAVLEEIQRRVPEATIYVSSLADFEKPQTCQKQDIENSRRLADFIAGTGRAQAGPVLPMVLDTWIQGSGGDGNCHVGSEGKAAFGMSVATFNWG